MALPVFEGFANILREQEERILQETAAVRALQESIQVNYAAVKLRIAQQQAGPPETRDRAVQVDAPEPSPDGLRPSAPPCCPCCSAHDVDGGGHSAHPRGPAPAPVEPPPPPIPTAGPAPQHTGAIAAVGDLLLTAVQRGFDVQELSDNVLLDKPVDMGERLMTIHVDPSVTKVLNGDRKILKDPRPAAVPQEADAAPAPAVAAPEAACAAPAPGAAPHAALSRPEPDAACAQPQVLTPLAASIVDQTLHALEVYAAEVDRACTAATSSAAAGARPGAWPRGLQTRPASGRLTAPRRFAPGGAGPDAGSTYVTTQRDRFVFELDPRGTWTVLQKVCQ